MLDIGFIPFLRYCSSSFSVVLQICTPMSICCSGRRGEGGALLQCAPDAAVCRQRPVGAAGRGSGSQPQPAATSWSRRSTHAPGLASPAGSAVEEISPAAAVAYVAALLAGPFPGA
jgi:hypothetical protein